MTRVACAPKLLEEVRAALVERAGRAVEIHALSDSELERICQSTHHEGLCVEAHARGWTSSRDLVSWLAERRGTAIALDRVRNSYNVGAILRSAAFFGVDALLLGAAPELDGNAIRVAEGGAEHVRLGRSTDLADTLSRLRERGVTIVGADARATRRWTEPVARPWVLVVGHEREGLSSRVRAACDSMVAVQGTGAIESLNVAIATSILLAGFASPRE